ncbi:uncharacterized protein LOC128735261 [Sabethes cyaneus]|uniref:uncharacterized protein LOC128735261 n=1 Tax=Sabethes cyaneus TaxID=53552 RepID=UPI00237D6A69|nr:uncharacterized protein LOC128735261 [Sabethes cyaneus]
MEIFISTIFFPGGQLYLKGFRERTYVPVNHPIDICLLKVGKSVFAASLNRRKMKDNTAANHTIVSFFFWNRNVKAFQKYMEYTGVLARKFECISHASLGFVAVVNYFNGTEKAETSPFNLRIDDGSPVFQIRENGDTEIIQRFSQSNQNTVHMWVHGKHIYLTHTYTNLDESVRNVCPLYRWSGYHFDAIDELPCYNSIHIEPFSIEQTLYLAIANQMNDEAVDEDTFSDLFKFDYERQKFVFHQKIYIYSVAHIAYMFLEWEDRREHFLVTGNSRAGKKNKAGKLDYDHHSIIYKFLNGYFVPFQKFELYSVKRFLPVMRENGEFLLLILCRGKPLLIYEYDGWKFSPSQIDYTREAFGAGVSRMRVYRHMIDASLIVIANRDLYGTTTNIFSPMYGVKNDLKDVYREFIEWCDDTTKQLESLDLEEIYNRLASGGSTVKIDSEVEVRNSTIEVLHTKVLKVGDFVFDQPIIDYLNAANRQLERLEKKAKELEKIIDGSFKLNETLEIKGDVKAPQIIASDALVRDLNATYVNGEITKRSADESHYEEVINVDRLIVEDHLDAKFLNGYASETLLHTTDDFTKLKNVVLFAPEVEIKGELFVQNLIDGIKFTEDNVLIDGLDQDFTGKTLRVNKLAVKNLVTNKLNSTNVNITTSSAQPTSKRNSSTMRQAQYREIHVKDLELTGLLNGVDINYLDKHALKRVGNQVITGEISFDKIIASKVVVPSNRLSGVELNSLVLTEPIGDHNYFTVRQDVEFTQPVYMEHVDVDERVSHIPVIDGKLQVLLQNSEEPQLVTGAKTFDNVRLLSPINLRGKISGSSLNKLNPIRTIEKDVYLEGDYEIKGNVTVEMLNATNIYGANKTYNFIDLYTHGLPLNAATSNHYFIFKQPVIADSVFATSLNGLDPRDLIQTTSKRVHNITGRKTFTGDVNMLGGSIKVDVINNVDLEHLNRTVLKRSEDQVIEGSIHFKKIILSSIVANRTLFEGEPLSTVLSTNSSERTWSTVRLEKCNLTIEGDLNVTDLLATNGSTVFGYDLDYLINDTLQMGKAEEGEPKTITGLKRFRNVTVGELILADRATLNGIGKERLTAIGKSFHNGTFIFESLTMEHPLHARNVFFNGSLNGVPKNEFGNSWLLNEQNQTFTAPQIFEHVIADKVFIDGYLNGVKIEQLMKNVYFLNENEHVENATFHGGIVSHRPVTVSGLVSGLNLETDVLLNSPIQHQYLKELRIDGNLVVTDKIHISDTLNGINYNKLREFTSGTGQPFNVEVQGNVYFEGEPEVVELNGYNLQQLHRDVWMTNRDEVLTGSYRFGEVHFKDYVRTRGPINGLDLDEISQTYLSLSKAQHVTTPLIFKGPVEFRNHTTVGGIVLKGLLKGSEESKGFDIVDFDRNVLKKNVEQTITGHWTFHDVEVHGAYNLTTINNLDLRKDILLADAPHATFTGSKQFENIHVRSLRCEAPCIIQGVDFTEWFANAVRLTGNHTIEGVTYLDSPTITGEVESFGPVNNITFDEDHLLLKSIPQTIKGNLYVKTKFPEKNLIYPLTVENLEVKTINGKNFNEFVANLARTDQSPLTIKTPVTLTQPLEARSIETGNNTIFGVHINSLAQKLEFDEEVKRYESKLRYLDQIGQSLIDIFNAKLFYLSHYQPVGPLEGHFGTLDMITISNSHQPPLQLLVAHVIQSNRTAVEFYRWNKKDSHFRIAKGFPSISSPKLVVNNLKTINLGRAQYLFVEFYNPLHHDYRQSILSAQEPDPMNAKKASKFVTWYEFSSGTSRDMITIKLFDLDCVGLYSSLVDGMEIHCLQRDNQEIYRMKLLQSIATPAVRQALYVKGRLILLGRDDFLQIWRPQSHYRLVLVQHEKIDHPSFITAISFDYQLFIAVNSESQVEDGAHHGSIEIWRDLRPQDRNGTFSKYQTIMASVPKQIRFSVLAATADLMLYTLSDRKFHPLVIYQYAGAAGFTQYLESKTLRTTASRLEVLKMERNQGELLALIGDDRVDLIEAVIGKK